jgi:Zn-dependent metalloprotease
MDDSDNVWGDFTLGNRQSVAVDAQYGTAVTWDYYKNVHGRNGIANNGGGSYNRVHYGSNYSNAFWSDSCFCMTYGDGDGITFNPFDSLDVAGHEMSHGVTSRTSNLTYSGESGGLNEGTSDIFGTMVEFYAANPNDTPDYLIGERLYKNGTSSLRNMARPSTDGKSADCWYSGVGSLNVHYSSGVANHFYFLLAEGTNPSGGPNSPTCNAGDTREATGNGSLTGIGRAKAEKIWYRALTVYMTASTNYAGARTATLDAARDLFGAGSTEQNTVAAAWSAVNVN